MDAKTNPMRLLDRLGIPYTVHEYSGVVAGMDVASALGEDPRQVCKTLVTEGKSGRLHVFIVSVDRELDLKKAASAVGEKSVSMLPSKELLPRTGYVHGGCSPLCLKRDATVVLDSAPASNERIYVSAGKVGLQIEMSTEDLLRAADIAVADVSR